MDTKKQDSTTDTQSGKGGVMSCSFDSFHDAIHFMEDECGLYKDFDWIYFTIGRGKKPYHFWTCSPYGFYYLFRLMPDGHAGARRAIENDVRATVFYSS